MNRVSFDAAYRQDSHVVLPAMLGDRCFCVSFVRNPDGTIAAPIVGWSDLEGPLVDAVRGAAAAWCEQNEDELHALFLK